MTLQPLYESPRGLYPFQADGVGRGYYTPDALALWDTGLGKTHLAMALAAVLFEDGLIDLVLVLAETNKIRDWVADFITFTSLTVDLYHGDKKKRTRLREAPPQVLVSTYETVKADAAMPNKELANPNMGNWLPGPMVIEWQGRRVFVVYDEVTKVRERTSGNYKAQEAFLRCMRTASDGQRTLGLTATPIESNPENVFNMGRLIVPHRVGTVAQFEHDHIVAKDPFGKPVQFKNIGFNDRVREPGVLTLREKFGDALLIKSKFDDDVKDEFPKQVEEYEAVPLGGKHLEFYRTVRSAFYDTNPTPMEERMLFGVLRQIAGHPLSLVRSKGQLAQAIVEQVGEAGLRAIGSAKEDYLSSRLERVCNVQGAKAIVFTFFGQSILPVLADRMRKDGLNVVINHGQMSSAERQVSIDALRYGDAQVFLSSDAGSRGLNLPEAHYVFNYECPLTYANLRQRNDRVHRIDSLAEIVFTETLIADDTIEEAVADLVVKRHEWHDTFIDDDDEAGEHLDAAERRRLIEFAKARTKTAKAA